MSSTDQGKRFVDGLSRDASVFETHETMLPQVIQKLSGMLGALGGRAASEARSIKNGERHGDFIGEATTEVKSGGRSMPGVRF